ncbi:MAG TPA: HAMP domain-containing sensor histidine kinase [Burkholderiales bacterium]|nr:HAMP domain-containing sensor histidine kinase [Burkholderiales bacterium]
MPARLYFLGHRARTLLAVSALLLAAVEIYIDWDTWIELNVAILYSLPLVVAAAARNRRLIWLLTLLLVASTFAVYALQIPPGAFTLREPFFVDRVLACATLLLIASLLHVLTLAADALDMRGTEAEQASTRKSRLLASVSHDMRTPLTTINVMADLIRHTADDPALAARVPELARSLQTSALSMSDMVADVLDISAIDSGRVAAHTSEFVLGELLAQELQGFQPLARAKGLSLELRPAEAPIRLRSDKVKLARVVRNLVMNAIKFTDAGGVTVSSEIAADRAVLISVSDTGVGIAPENLDRIFGEFAQLRVATDAEKRGWGLGLAICRRLVAMMDGTVSVESTLNRGSRFTVRLPPECVVY